MSEVPRGALREELEQLLNPALVPLLDARDGAGRLLRQLASVYSGDQVLYPSSHQRAWELTGHYFRSLGRPYEGLAIYAALYRQILKAQNVGGKWAHKGMPLVWMSDTYNQLGYPSLAKRFLMLTLCEDALRDGGAVSPETSGVYVRLVWAYGVSDVDVQRYANEFWRIRAVDPERSLFPEWLLQNVDQGWMTELPSAREASVYVANQMYIEYLMSSLGNAGGNSLEQIAEYLMSCMPGCRTARRRHSPSTDYDLVCAMEGFELDYRSELGRYFVCECKDWEMPADFTTMAKFCRVLDSTKAKFGILFSKHGISGAHRTLHAEREQLKIFQDRGIVIVVFDHSDIKRVASGHSLIQILRQKYEAIRLDLRSSIGDEEPAKAV